MKYILTIILLLLLQRSNARDIPPNTEKRIALIIGNADYVNGTKLKNPKNDANLMADSLKKIGFDTIKRIDVDKSAFEKAIYDFSKKLSQYDIILFFYAGHGVQIDGINYLLPVDAVLNEKNDVKFQAVSVNFITEEFERYPGKTSIIILDACRNNPFRSWMRGGETGFKSIAEQPAGSIIAYATRENSTAFDGVGNNGLYTENLVREIMKPQSINEVFNNTRDAVLKKSKYSQLPQEWNMLIKNFYFIQPITERSTISDFNSGKLMNAVYSIHSADEENKNNCKVTEFQIFDVNDTTFQIKGLGQTWSGKGKIHKGNTGQYDWLFENGRKGSTYIKINSHGSINGKVDGSTPELDWIYIAYPMN